MLKQVYDHLDVAGKAGLTIAELARQLGLQLLDGRILLRNLCRKGLAVCTLHDKGKAAINKYVSYALSVNSIVIIIVIIIGFISSSSPSSYLYAAFL